MKQVLITDEFKKMFCNDTTVSYCSYSTIINCPGTCGLFLNNLETISVSNISPHRKYEFRLNDVLDLANEQS